MVIKYTAGNDSNCFNIQIIPAIVEDIAALAKLYDDLNDFLAAGRIIRGG